jgi:hypothetical protein
VIVAIAAPIAAIALSRRRLGTATLIALGALVGLVLVRRSLFFLVDEVLDKVKPENEGAVDRLLERLLDPLFTATGWIVGIAALLVVALYLVSDKRGARWVRGAVPRAGHAIVTAAEGNKAVAPVVVVALGLLVLWTVDLGWLATLVLVGVTGGLAWAVGQLPDPAGADDGDGDLPSDPPAAATT